jgi:hypothetical protein
MQSKEEEQEKVENLEKKIERIIKLARCEFIYDFKD